MKSILNYIVLLPLLAFCTSLTLAAQDTLLFTYQESSGHLSLKRICNTLGTDLYFKVDQSDFSRSLQRDADVRTFIGSSYGFLQNANLLLTRTDQWFDSAQCAALDVRLYDGDYEGIASAKQCIVVVKIEHADTTVVASVQEQIKPTGGIYFLDPIVIAVAAIALIFVVGLVIIIVRKIRKKKQIATKTNLQKTASLEMVEVVEKKFVSGLDYISECKNEYYLIDLQKVFTDTAVHKVYLHHSAVKKMYDFFKLSLESSDQTNETGCYFVGCWEFDNQQKTTYNISLEDIVLPGDDIQPGEFSFNFGLKIGVNLYSAIESLTKKTNRDFVQTVWMHSHPGLGLFLSSHDLLVQNQLTYSDAKNRLVAFVVDTNTPNLDLAVFSAKANGAMNNKDDLTRLYSLEEMYAWSRRTFSSSPSSHMAVSEVASVALVDAENYFSVRVLHHGNNAALNVCFNGRTINAIDDFLYKSTAVKAAVGYLVGENNGSGVLKIDDCIDIHSDKPDWMVGLLIVDAGITNDDIRTKYSDNSSCSCLLISREDDIFLLLARRSEKEQFPSLADAVECSMKSMKEWLRRRRVYK